MGFSNLTLSLSEEIIDFLDSIGNKSEYVREAIDEKRGKAEQSIQELEIEVNNNKTILNNSELKLMAKVDQLLQHKEDLKLGEINELEDKVLRKTKQQEEFVAQWSPILIQHDEIKDFQFIDGWESVANLLPLIDVLRKKNIRIGIIQLREFLSLMPIQDKEPLVALLQE